MGVPDDANPLNRRLPAEVVSRRHKEPKKDKEETPIEIDRSKVLAMKGEQRVKWLAKVLQGFQQGRVQSSSIYDIVAHSKFASEVPDKVGVKMYRIVHAHLALFSAKQQRFLEGDCKLAEKFREAALKRRESERGDGEASRQPQASQQQHHAASSADDGDRERASSKAGPSGGRSESSNLSELWDRLTKLTPQERAAAVDSLDATTKQRLEEFLVARIGARGNAGGSGGNNRAGGSSSGSRSRSSGSSSAPRGGGRNVAARSGSRDAAQPSQGLSSPRRSEADSSAAGGKKEKVVKEQAAAGKKVKKKDRGEKDGTSRHKKADADLGGRRGLAKGKGRRGRSSSSGGRGDSRRSSGSSESSSGGRSRSRSRGGDRGRRRRPSPCERRDRRR